MKLTKQQAKYRKKLFATFHMKKEEQKEIDRACNAPFVKCYFHNPYQSLYLAQKIIEQGLDLLRSLKAGE